MGVRDRAAILPYPGDPYLFNFWLKFYDKYWGSEVNRLYVHMNSPVEKEIVEYVEWLCEKRDITLLYTPNYTDHGNAINKLLDIVQEKYVMLIEDDAFIWNAAVVDSAFALLESGNYDIVGSKRGSCGNLILEGAKKKWGLSYAGLGDQGPNFWPNFFFCSVELLKKTDRNFNARTWVKGETIEPLGCVVTEEVETGDTFVNTSLQLRAMVPKHRIAYLPQYHSHPEDLVHAEKNQWLFDGLAPWCHIGSLSSGISGLLKDDQNRPLASRNRLEPAGPTILGNKPNTEMELMEYERRVQIWLTGWEASAPIFDTQDFHKHYRYAIERVIKEFGLSPKRIRQRQKLYNERLFKL